MEKICSRIVTELNNEFCARIGAFFANNTGTNFSLLSIGKASTEQHKIIKREIFSKIPHLNLTRELIISKKSDGVQKSTEAHHLEASHPYSDSSSISAGKKASEFLQQTKAHDTLILCLSGGASALCIEPFQNMDLNTMWEMERILLRSGAGIGEMNLLRNEFSKLKRGGMKVFARHSKIITLITSDVPDNDLRIIGGSPTYHYSVSQENIINIAQKYLQKTHVNILSDYLNSKEKIDWETQVQHSHREIPTEHHILMNYASLLECATKIFHSQGIMEVVSLQKAFYGNFNSEKNFLKKSIKAWIKENRDKKAALIAGGELTVEVQGKGRGGRNTEFVAQMAKIIFEDNELELSLSELKRITIMAFATDGTDGPTEYAGGFLTYQKYLSQEAEHNTLTQALSDNDSLGYLLKANRAFKTGPTGTNLMDFYAIIYNYTDGGN